ncbi:MAG: polysaccharide biosynthesis/export family protein [Candidatus Korobacteraceae bacterium]|jgi:polysaccharide export outer membrane protein
MRNPFIFLLSTLFFSAILVAQVAPQASVPSGDQETEAQISAAAAAAADKDYVIGADDVLHISVWKEPEMTVTLPVRTDGKISMPLINEVVAAGMTPYALQQEITKRSSEFVARPQVTVIVTEVHSKKVYVVGEVLHPGTYSFSSGLTALQALTTAGGLNQFANAKRIVVLRKQGSSGVTLRFDYNAVVRHNDLKADIDLKPGDTIIVR